MTTLHDKIGAGIQHSFLSDSSDSPVNGLADSPLPQSENYGDRKKGNYIDDSLR